ncbi:MAG: hypothetical protein C4527_15840 [Candidatus Omnitrophota bacterium]|jgi:hypothetical protein|nr:MAG: hypothetical protein C4527_15840 [Candidatus Omnitrophota bacterium]
MKKTTKNLLLIYAALLLVMIGIFYVILFVYKPPSKKSQDDVIISHQKPASFTDQKPPYFSPSDSTPFATVSPAPSATVSPLPADQWTLLIQDPLGDPIPAGIVAVGSESLSFIDGHITFPAAETRELSVRVSAEGYAPGEFAVTPGSLPLVLDYLCDFFIQVENEKGDPVPNTTVLVWNSNPPPRPIGDQAAAYTHINSLENPIHLTMNGKECQVSRVDEPIESIEKYGSPDGRVYPKVGDRIMALGACTWHPGYTPLYIHQGYDGQRGALILGEFLPLTARHSTRLRIWDTLRLTEQVDSNQANINTQILEILRDDQRWYYFLIFPECPVDQPPQLKKKTDEKGELVLRSIPPALYYAQAFDDKNRSSGILPLHPACGGARLRLNGEGDFRVYVKREGLPTKNAYYTSVSEAEVLLQSQKGLRIYSETTDSSGTARYRKLPYGNYRLTVKALGQIVEKTITFNKPVDSCLVTLQQDELYTISGIVLEQDSGVPVADYALVCLNEYEDNLYQEAITDAEGCFEFPNVIPGKYCLAENVNSIGDLKYIFANPTLNYLFLQESSSHFGTFNLNVYEDIQDLEIRVKPVVKTMFSGIVVDTEDVPVADARITVSPMKFNEIFDGHAKLYPENSKTDANGLFTVTMFNHRQTVNQYFEYEVAAMLGRMAPSRWLPNPYNPKNYSLVKEKFQPSSLGSIIVAGDMGDTITDLRIVIEPYVTDKTLQGKLVAEGEDQFAEVNIYANQGNQDIPIRVNQAGNFKAENISAGDLRLVIYPHIHASVYTPYGLQNYLKYRKRTVIIPIEEGQPQTYAEIPLLRSGYFWGHVMDGDGTPLPNAVVAAKDRANSDQHFGSTITNANGFFFISSSQLSFDETYNIKYRVGEQRKVLYDVSPNTGDLLLQ